MLKFWATNLVFVVVFGVLIFADRHADLSAWIYVTVAAGYIVIQAYGSAVLSAQFFMPVKYRGDHPNRIALTFDDGPVPGKTEAILKILASHNVPAAFFCIGNALQTIQHLPDESTRPAICRWPSAAKALETVRLMQQEEEKLRMEKELMTAHEVQLALLTADRLESDVCELSANSVPSRYVDGDFFDLFTIEGGRMAFLLGDVAGKGIPAALLASMAQGVLHTHLSAGANISSAVHTLNRFFVAKNSSWRFLTLFCGVRHPDGRLTFLNAGHNPPLLIDSNGARYLAPKPGLMMGAMTETVYVTERLILEPEGIFFLYTDGVTEAKNPEDALYGEWHLPLCDLFITIGWGSLYWRWPGPQGNRSRSGCIQSI